MWPSQTAAKRSLHLSARGNIRQLREKKTDDKYQSHAETIDAFVLVSAGEDLREELPRRWQNGRYTFDGDNKVLASGRCDAMFVVFTFGRCEQKADDRHQSHVDIIDAWVLASGRCDATFVVLTFGRCEQKADG